jgi:hypothetical protein
MLNLKIAMRILMGFIPVGYLVLLSLFVVKAQESTGTSSPEIDFISPDPGQALQGTVLIRAATDFNEAKIVRLSFAYDNDPRGTWFLIQERKNISQQDLNFEWDTTTITDGDYILRMDAETIGGEYTAYIPGLRVRNYSAVETNTPFPTSTPAPQETKSPTASSIRTITPVPPTATSQPPNPAQITQEDISSSMLKGALITLSLFGCFGLYLFLRARKRKKR